MPITDLLTRNAKEYPNETALVEINPELSEPSRITESNRYYSFAIGNTGTVSEKVPTDFVGLRADDKIHGVMRNLQYNTTITVTGPGYKTPVGPKYDETFLDVKVEVVPFGEVDQDVEI